MSKRLQPFPTLVLDLDGTLVDSLADMTASLNRLMAAWGLATFAASDVAPLVGDGTSKLVERAFSARGRSAEARDAEAFLADYVAHAPGATRPYPGAPEALSALRKMGWELAICTNKPAAVTRSLLDALGLARCFAAVGGGDSFAARKPDPVHLLGTIAAAGGKASRAVMVGDHANDMDAARAADVPSIFAAWGYGAPAMAAGATAVARQFSELATIAPRLLR